MGFILIILFLVFGKLFSREVLCFNSIFDSWLLCGEIWLFVVGDLLRKKFFCNWVGVGLVWVEIWLVVVGVFLGMKFFCCCSVGFVILSIGILCCWDVKGLVWFFWLFCNCVLFEDIFCRCVLFMENFFCLVSVSLGFMVIVCGLCWEDDEDLWLRIEFWLVVIDIFFRSLSVRELFWFGDSVGLIREVICLFVDKIFFFRGDLWR